MAVYIYTESNDTIDAYGAERGAFVSSDNGANWERVKERDYFPLIGISLENGETVQFIELPSIPVTEEMKFPTPEATKGRSSFYRAEYLDDSICNQTWLINCTSKEHPEGIMEPVNLNWPNMLVRVGDGIVVPPSVRATMGTPSILYILLIRTNGTGADVRGPSYLVCSTDKGVTWSEPVKFDNIGVWPRLCSLKCG